MNQKGFSYIIVILSIAVFISIVGGYIFYQKYFRTATSLSYQVTSSMSPANKTPTVSLEKCSKYGINKDKDDLYTKYSVKSGDTLLSIAKNQLGDVSRIGDIIYINRDSYPGLSNEKPFLEVGWVLYLPPDYVKRIDTIGQGIPNLLYSASGEVVSITKDGEWVVKLNQNNPEYTIVPGTNTKFIGKTKQEYNSGDCLTSIMQENTMNVYTVSPQ